MDEHNLIKFCNTKCLFAKDSYLNKNIDENFNENYDKTIDQFDSNGFLIIGNFDDSKVKISHLHNYTNKNWNEKVKCDKMFNSDKLKFHYQDFHRKIYIINNLKAHLLYKYLIIYVKFYILSHYETRITVFFTCNNSKKSYITRGRSCLCFITNIWYKNSFLGYDIYMFILKIIHIKCRIEFGISINIIYFDIFPNKTLNFILFLCAVSYQSWSNWVIVAYVFNIHNDYESLCL